MASRMTIMIDRPRKFVLLAMIAAGMLPVAAAHAHWDGLSYAEPAPLYPYAVQEEQPYAVELAPNIYAIPYRLRAYPYVHCLDGCGRRAPVAQWRRRGHMHRTVINTTRTVHDAPLVIETERVVDDPPRGIERRHVVEDAPAHSRDKQAAGENRDTGGGDAKPRVIQADAEITVIEPDRMIIRLFRRPPGPRAKAPADQ
jgi:hypothetical protein